MPRSGVVFTVASLQLVAREGGDRRRPEPGFVSRFGPGTPIVLSAWRHDGGLAVDIRCAEASRFKHVLLRGISAGESRVWAAGASRAIVDPSPGAVSILGQMETSGPGFGHPRNAGQRVASGTACRQ